MTESNHELNEQVEALIVASQNEREALRKASITTMIVSGTLVVIVTIFALINYFQVKTEWTEEKLTAGFQKELEVLNPAASEQLQELGRHLLPVYAQASREQFLALTPEISARLRTEVDHLGTHMRHDANDRLTGSIERVGSHTEEIAFAAYPALKDIGEREKLTENFREQTETAVMSATNDFAKMFAKEILVVEKQIRGFNNTDNGESTVELQKRFIHLWLQLLDLEIMKK